jgi:hypothetical protein
MKGLIARLLSEYLDYVIIFYHIFIWIYMANLLYFSSQEKNDAIIMLVRYHMSGLKKECGGVEKSGSLQLITDYGGSWGWWGWGHF